VFGLEDDENWNDFITNPEIEMRKFLYEATGSKDFSEIVTHGLPRAIGVDVSTRIGLQNMLIQWGQGEHSVTSTIANTIFGPLFGTSNSFQRGFDHIANGGDLMRSLEYFMPKAVRDLTRTYRYANTGMTDWNNNVIQNPEAFSSTELVSRALGFGTSTEAETYMGRSYVQQLKNKVMKKRKAFMNKYASADSRREQREIWQEIQEFNKNLPKDMKRKYKLTRSALVKSMRNRRKLERETEDGVRLDRRERQLGGRVKFTNP
jgi:hypothetical protein